MKRTITVAAALCLGLGCGGVLSVHPVGADPVHAGEAEWEGTWLGDDGSFELRVVDGAAGKLEVAWIEDEGDRFILRSLPLELRRLEDWTIGSLYDSEERKYLWMRVVADGSRLIVWLPDEGEFARLITTGALPGDAEEGELPVLARLEPAHLETIRRGGPALFAWDDPMIFRRVGS